MPAPKATTKPSGEWATRCCVVAASTMASDPQTVPAGAPERRRCPRPRRRSPTPSGRHRPRRVPGEVGFEPVEGELVAGEGQRGQGGDVGRPRQGVAEITGPLGQPEAQGGLGASSSAASSMARAGLGAGQQSQSLHGPVVDHQAEFCGRDAKPGRRGGHPQVAGHRQLGAARRGRHPGLRRSQGGATVRNGVEQVAEGSGELGVVQPRSDRRRRRSGGRRRSARSPSTQRPRRP